MTDLERSQIVALQRQGLGYKKIAIMTGIALNTVKSYCRRNPINPVEVVPSPTDPRPCRYCGKPVQQDPHRKPKFFCTDKCRMAWWKEHPDQMNRSAVYQFTCEYCGTGFESYGNSKRRYCSRACYQRSRGRSVSHE